MENKKKPSKKPIFIEIPVEEVNTDNTGSHVQSRKSDIKKSGGCMVDYSSLDQSKTDKVSSTKKSSFGIVESEPTISESSLRSNSVSSFIILFLAMMDNTLYLISYLTLKRKKKGNEIQRDLPKFIERWQV